MISTLILGLAESKVAATPVSYKEVVAILDKVEREVSPLIKSLNTGVPDDEWYMKIQGYETTGHYFDLTRDYNKRYTLHVWGQKKKWWFRKDKFLAALDSFLTNGVIPV